MTTFEYRGRAELCTRRQTPARAALLPLLEPHDFSSPNVCVVVCALCLSVSVCVCVCVKLKT